MKAMKRVEMSKSGTEENSDAGTAQKEVKSPINPYELEEFKALKGYRTWRIGKHLVDEQVMSWAKQDRKNSFLWKKSQICTFI